MKALFLPIFFQDKLHTQRWLRLPKVYLLYHEFKNINRYLLRKLQFSFLFSNLTFIPICFKILTEHQKAEIKDFFQNYKTLQNIVVETKEFHNMEVVFLSFDMT